MSIPSSFFLDESLRHVMFAACLLKTPMISSMLVIHVTSWSTGHVSTCPVIHTVCLSLPRSLPSGLFPCGVCRLPIDVTYGQFSCNKGCHYAVHSRCAVEGKVWDGKDLEGVPEEPDEDVEPFVRVDDETIQHFSHEHYLRLNMSNGVCDEDRFCQACIIPIFLSESFYGCTQCSFLLHEACASFPRKKDHPIHKHRLILHPIPPKPLEVVQIQGGTCKQYSEYVEGMFKCSGCDQSGYGFVYICSEEGCQFQLDALQAR